MKKLLLVVFVGIVLAINIYGIINYCINNIDYIEETTMTVYVE